MSCLSYLSLTTADCLDLDADEYSTLTVECPPDVLIVCEFASTYPVGAELGTVYVVGAAVSGTYPVGAEVGSAYAVGAETGAAYPVGAESAGTVN